MKTPFIVLTALITAFSAGCGMSIPQMQAEEKTEINESSEITGETLEVPDGYEINVTGNEEYQISFYTAPGATVPEIMEYDENTGRYIAFVDLNQDGNDMFTEVSLYVQGAEPEKEIFCFDRAQDLKEYVGENQQDFGNGYETGTGEHFFDVTEAKDISVNGWSGYEAKMFSMAGGDGYEACITSVRRDGMTVTIYNQSFFDLTKIGLVSIEKK